MATVNDAAEVAIATVVVTAIEIPERTIVVIQVETITEALGEPEADQNHLTMIDTIDQEVAETAVMKIDPESVAPAAIEMEAEGVRNLLLRERASLPHQNQPMTKEIDVPFSCNNSRLDSGLGN